MANLSTNITTAQLDILSVADLFYNFSLTEDELKASKNLDVGMLGIREV